MLKTTMIATIDWVQVGFVLLGTSLGAFIGYRINRWRFRIGAPGTRDFAKHAQEPANSALLLGLAAFAGCTVAHDVATFLRGPKPDAFVLNYLFGAVIGIGHYVFLERIARESRESSLAG